MWKQPWLMYIHVCKVCCKSTFWISCDLCVPNDVLLFKLVAQVSPSTECVVWNPDNKQYSQELCSPCPKTILLYVTYKYAYLCIFICRHVRRGVEVWLYDCGHPAGVQATCLRVPAPAWGAEGRGLGCGGPLHQPPADGDVCWWVKQIVAAFLCQKKTATKVNCVTRMYVATFFRFAGHNLIPNRKKKSRFWWMEKQFLVQ